MMLIDLDRAELLHLAVALDVHARNLRDQHGAALPAALEELRAHAWRVARGDSVGQDTTTLAELAATLHAPPVERLAYTLEEMGQVLGVSVRSVQRLIASGALVAVRIGDGAVRVRRADADAYLAGLEPSRPARPLAERIEVKQSPMDGEQQPTPGRALTRRPVPVSRGGAA